MTKIIFNTFDHYKNGKIVGPMKRFCAKTHQGKLVIKLMDDKTGMFGLTPDGLRAVLSNRPKYIHLHPDSEHLREKLEALLAAEAL